jgi:hypothetical protein
VQLVTYAYAPLARVAMENEELRMAWTRRKTPSVP